MKDSLRLLAILLLWLLAAPSAYAAGPVAPKLSKEQLSIDFAGPVAVIDLKDLLTPYTGAAWHETEGSRWYVLSATNGSVRPVTRVLVAADPPDAALHIFPLRVRPEMLQVASSDSGVDVERLRAVGRHAFLVTVPPATTSALAIRVANSDVKPLILAWNESALVSHDRQVAIFLAVVAGLIAAAAAIMAGMAVITSRPAPGWSAVILILVFLARLQGAEILDTEWMTVVGGPYGLGAMLAGLALAAALRLTDFVAPLRDIWRSAERWWRWILLAQVVLSAAAFLGVPAATFLTYVTVVLGTAFIAAYLVHRGLQGCKAARVVAPSAVIFALVVTTGAAAALGAFYQNPMASGMIAGFTAAGAVLLALAIAAGEGVAILPLANGKAGMTTPDGSESVATLAIGAAHQGVFNFDFDTDRLHLSRQSGRMIGLKGAESYSQQEWLARIHPDDRQIYLDAFKEYRTHPRLAFRMEFRVRNESGHYPWLELRASIIVENRHTRCVGLLADVTSRKEAELSLTRRSLNDPLTGLGNRVALLEELERMGEAWASLAFAILDIDRFKAIHASLGDDGGDRLLADLASRIPQRFAADTVAFRIGGDSFAILVPSAADYAARLGAELIDLCSIPFSIKGRNIFASSSVGIAAGRHSEDPLELIRHAELALSVAKRQGGGCWKLFTSDMEELVRGDAVALEADLRRGLSQNEFVVYYQPIIRLGDGSVAGFEALLRWRHPQKGLVCPETFIAHSEETGLIVALGRFALERAASDLADWQRYFPVNPALFVSVNVSRRQLRESNFASSIEKLLAAGEFRERTFKLEVTESAIEIDSEALRILNHLREMGAGLAIDDFGTGLSNLSQLKDLPFDTLKIDRSFLARHTGAEDDADATAVITSIVTLARQLKRTIIVEGVETERDAIWLAQLGCEFAQGFYFSQPLAGEDALKFIASHFRADSPREDWHPEGNISSSSASGMRR